MSSRMARNPAVPLAVLTAALLVAFAGRYGYHRDELYFIVAGEHLAWAYADQGPLTPLIARAMEELAGGSLTVLRIPSALMTGAIVLLTGLLARELGGSRRAEAIAAGCAAVGVVFLSAGHLLSTTTFDLLAWTLVVHLVVRAMRCGDDRLFLVAGVVLGLGLLNKPLPAFLALGLLAGVAVAGPRRLIRSPWVWAGAAVALVLWAPWLIWQADRGWPQVDVSRDIAAGGSTSSEPRWAVIPFQVLLVSPFLAPVWIAGLVALFRRPELRDLRFLGWTWVVLAFVFIATGGKPYYLAGLFPVLLAVGSLTVDRWLERGSRAVRRALLVGAFALSVLIGGPIGLPVLPVEDTEPVLAANDDVGNTIGWPGFVEQVAAVHRREAVEVIFTSNYGQAGSIERFGGRHGLPRVYSGHNAYHEWGPPPDRLRGRVLVIGDADRSGFRGCTLAGEIEIEHGIETDEQGTRLWTCAGPSRPWSELWPDLERLG
jgi:4-amino-4-deoxy-L-arabinose transferase-like glycosyltransferase